MRDKFRHVPALADPIEVKSCFGGAALFDYERQETNFRAIRRGERNRFWIFWTSGVRTCKFQSAHTRGWWYGVHSA